MSVATYGLSVVKQITPELGFFCDHALIVFAKVGPPEGPTGGGRWDVNILGTGSGCIDIHG